MLVATTISFTLLGLSLGPARYGTFLGLAAVTGAMASFTVGGSYLTVLDRLARSGRSPLAVIRSCVTMTTIIAVVAIALSTVIVASSVPGIAVMTIVLLASADLLLAGVGSVLAGVLQVKVSFAAMVISRASYHLGRALMIVVLWRIDRLDLPAFGVGQAVVAGSYCLGTATYVGRRFRSSRLAGSVDRSDAGSIVAYSLGLSGLAVQNDGDNFALNRFGYQEAAGIYGFAYRAVQLGLLPINAFLNATHVSFLRLNQTTRPLDRALQLARIAAVYVVVVSVGLWFVAGLDTVLPDEFHGAGTIARWLIPLIGLRGLGGFAMNGLLGLGQNNLRTKILVVNALFAVVLYALLVPDHSWRGAAVATQLSEITLLAASWTGLVVHQRRADTAPSVVGATA